MKIRNKITLNFLVVFILVSILTSAIVGFFLNQIIKNNIYSYLHTNNISKAQHIRTFIQSKQKTSEILAAASVYRDFLNEPKNPIIKKKIDERLERTLQIDSQIIEVVILDKNGKVVASSNKNNEGEDESKDDYFIEGSKKTFIKDVYFVPETSNVTYAIASPIKNNSDDLLGVSLIRFTSEKIYGIVEINESRIGNSEESFLINKDRYFITPSKFLGGKVILNQKVETENENKCFEKKEIEYNSLTHQIIKSRDYRNVDVIATHSYIPETEWCLITKIDLKDVLLFQKVLAFIILLVVILVVVIYFFIGLIISKKITGPILDLKIGAKKIEEGDFDYKIDIKSQDEIGELSKTFNTMTEVLKESKMNIEKRVNEQTKELNQKTKELEDQKKAVINILADVEREKVKVETLANDLEKFKLAVENASDQVVIADSEGKVIYGNKVVEQITGFKLNEVLGTKAGTLWKKPMPTEYYKKMWDVIKNKKQVFKSEIENRRKNGEMYTADISISPVLDKNNQIIYFVAIEHDITKQKEVDKAKTEFVSLASHQLRTPLSSINWYTEMLLAQDAGPINEEQRKYLQEVATGNQRMVALVNSLLNVSRLDLGTFMIEPEKLQISDIAKSVFEEMKPQIIEKELEISQNYSPNLPEILADQKLTRIILQNLVSNAVKYTPPKGKVSIDIKIQKKDEVIGGNKLTEDSFVISISDSGIGIPISQKDKIFSKLFRADNARESETEGTGLGLYIVKSIIDQSGGLVWFESKENGGTTFFVILPITGMKKKEGSKQLD